MVNKERDWRKEESKWKQYVRLHVELDHHCSNVNDLESCALKYLGHEPLDPWEQAAIEVTRSRMESEEKRGARLKELEARAVEVKSNTMGIKIAVDDSILREGEKLIEARITEEDISLYNQEGVTRGLVVLTNKNRVIVAEFTSGDSFYFTNPINTYVVTEAEDLRIHFFCTSEGLEVFSTLEETKERYMDWGKNYPEDSSYYDKVLECINSLQ